MRTLKFEQPELPRKSWLDNNDPPTNIEAGMIGFGMILLTWLGYMAFTY